MVPLYKPYMPKLPDMDQILHSGHLAAGEHSREFEKRLNEYFGVDKVLVTSAFHTAVSVALTSMGLTYGDEVIASPMACLASTQPYATAGLKVIWADIDPSTGTLDPGSVHSKISTKTKAILHNHFCGYPGYIDEINEIGRQHGITVFDDGIECFGTIYKDRLIGNCGTDVTVFSFNPVRMLTTIDGGAIIFRDGSSYDRAVLVRDCGIDRSKFRDDMGEIRAECDISIQGYSATLSNVNGYIGICQMPSLEIRLEHQRKNAEKWEEILLEFPDYKPVQNDNGIPNYWVYGITAPDKRECIQFFRDKGFYASGVHINNNIYTVFGMQETLPGVQEFYDHFVALPCGWWMEEEDWRQMEDI